MKKIDIKQINVQREKRTQKKMHITQVGKKSLYKHRHNKLNHFKSLYKNASSKRIGTLIFDSDGVISVKRLVCIMLKEIVPESTLAVKNV